MRPPRDTIVIGEIGLTGEIRNVQNLEKILKESYRMGYRKAVVPYSNEKKINESVRKEMEVRGCKSVRDAISFCFDQS